ncbi:MAG: methyl-accepting chemotaxis protein [Lachnospiraceae bacterium]
MKIRGKILILSLLPVTLVTVESIFFTNLYLKNYPEARSIMLFPLIRIGAITLVITFFVVYLVATILTKSIKNVSNGLEALAQGDLNAPISERAALQKDEAGMLAQSAIRLKTSLAEIVIHMNESAVALSETAGSLSSMTDNTASVSESLASAMSDISEGISSEASSTQSIKKEMDQIKSMADNSLKSTQNFKAFMDEIQDSSNRGQALVHNLDANADATMQEIETIAKQTQSTHQASLEIGTAAEFISSIATETNLLALNASIEAARAGEQGKGFAVVANQIKNLAEQSSNSVKTIDANIKNLLSESDKTVASMQRVQSVINDQNQDIKETYQLFISLNENITKAATEVNSISDYLSELTLADKKVAAEVENLSASAQESAASTEEVTASSEELSSTAETLADHAGRLSELSEKIKELLSQFH